MFVFWSKTIVYINGNTIRLNRILTEDAFVTPTIGHNPTSSMTKEDELVLFRWLFLCNSPRSIYLSLSPYSIQIKTSIMAPSRTGTEITVVSILSTRVENGLVFVLLGTRVLGGIIKFRRAIARGLSSSLPLRLDCQIRLYLPNRILSHNHEKKENKLTLKERLWLYVPM